MNVQHTCCVSTKNSGATAGLPSSASELRRIQPENLASTKHYVFAALLGLLLVGCQSSFDTDVLERELRMQEDYIYELQDEIEQYKRALGKCEKQDEKETSAVKRTPAA
ncbi:MAG: hypothetical protein ACC645_03795, partial [Pirellulales bacterium]